MRFREEALMELTNTTDRGRDMDENNPTVGEKEEESPELAIERLNTLLGTAENSLREMTNERNRERILREKHEREIVMLKGDMNRIEREKGELEAKLAERDEAIAKADAKRRQEVERAGRLKAEADTLRRANAALKRQAGATGEEVGGVQNSNVATD
jgi:chromosome segregation ATPase